MEGGSLLWVARADESRDSRPDLWAARGEIPRADPADGEGKSRWGYDRIVGAMANLGLQLSDQTVGNILPAMIFHRLPSGSRQRVGKTLSVLTWRYWWRSTSSRWKWIH
jgi:hypothetical protein